MLRRANVKLAMVIGEVFVMLHEENFIKWILEKNNLKVQTDEEKEIIRLKMLEQKKESSFLLEIH